MLVQYIRVNFTVISILKETFHLNGKSDDYYILTNHTILFIKATLKLIRIKIGQTGTELVRLCLEINTGFFLPFTHPA